mmetsp:Transcript_17762/g.26803  ORF Transcript_17762/g.26803 Transcript_17762/m.26803 type:complete len:318 (+) Transcript_17762:551-1504(+)
MHVRLRDVGDGHRDVVLPHQNLLVIGGGHNPAVLLHEGDGVHRAQVVVVQLHNLPRAHVPLDNLVIRAASKEDIFILWIESGAIGHFSVGEGRHRLAGLGVPDAREPVEGHRDELGAGGVEPRLAHAHAVPRVGALDLALAVGIPDLDLRVHRATEQQVAVARQPLHVVHTLGVPRPFVHATLGGEGLVVPAARARALGRGQPAAPLVVALPLAVEDRGRLGRLRVPVVPRGQQVAPLALVPPVVVLLHVVLAVLGLPLGLEGLPELPLLLRERAPLEVRLQALVQLPARLGLRFAFCNLFGFPLALRLEFSAELLV